MKRPPLWLRRVANVGWSIWIVASVWIIYDACWGGMQP